MSCLGSRVTPCSGRQQHSYCSKHYQQVRRFGAPAVSRRDKRPAIVQGDTVKIPIGVNGKDGYALVDKEYAYLAEDNWHLTHYGYARRSRDKALLHRVVGNANSGEVVDHINGGKLDNRSANIRVCSQADNAKNQRVSSSNTSGYKGVYFDKQKNKFVARVKHNYRTYYAGAFTTAKDAGAAYDKLAKDLHGEFARLNNVVA